MGLFERIFASEGPSERLVRAFERLAAAAERERGGFRSDGPSQKLSDRTSQVFYTSDVALALEEARREAYEQAVGRPLGLNEEVPGPENPETGRPWGEEAPEQEGSASRTED